MSGQRSRPQPDPAKRPVESSTGTEAHEVDTSAEPPAEEHPAQAIVRAAGRALGAAGRSARRSARRRHAPLPNLFVVHPEAIGAQARELGLQAIPISEIRGTAVDGYDQRGLDFAPLPPFRSRDWQARWQRILAATARLETLPPIEVVHAGGAYWVVDGHNRVAAARRMGQLEVDALVRGIRLPGDPPEPPSGSLAAMLLGGEELRAAGEGRRSPPTGPSAGEAEPSQEPSPEPSPGEPAPSDERR